MPRFYGYGFHHGGYAEYLNGRQRFDFHGKPKTEENDEHKLEKVDKQILPDYAGNRLVQPSAPGVPVNQAVNNEISIDDTSHEHAKLIGLTNSMPVSMDLNRNMSSGLNKPNKRSKMTVKNGMLPGY